MCLHLLKGKHWHLNNYLKLFLWCWLSVDLVLSLPFLGFLSLSFGKNHYFPTKVLILFWAQYFSSDQSNYSDKITAFKFTNFIIPLYFYFGYFSYFFKYRSCSALAWLSFPFIINIFKIVTINKFSFVLDW